MYEQLKIVVLLIILQYPEGKGHREVKCAKTGSDITIPCSDGGNESQASVDVNSLNGSPTQFMHSDIINVNPPPDIDQKEKVESQDTHSEGCPSNQSVILYPPPMMDGKTTKMYVRGTKLTPLPFQPKPPPLELNLKSSERFTTNETPDLPHEEVIEPKNEQKKNNYYKIPKWVVWFLIILLILILITIIVLIIFDYQNDLAEKEKCEELDEEFSLFKKNKQNQRVVANMQEQLYYQKDIGKNIASGAANPTFVTECSEFILNITNLISDNALLVKDNSEFKVNNTNLMSNIVQLENENSEFKVNNTNLMSKNAQLIKNNSDLKDENQQLSSSLGITTCPTFCLYSDCEAESDFETEYLKKIPDGDVKETITRLKKIKNGHAIIALDASGSMSGSVWNKQIEAYDLLVRGLTLGGWNTLTTILYSSNANILFNSITPEEALNYNVPFDSGGTNFDAAMTQMNNVLATTDQTRAHILLFLSDGSSGYPSAQVARMNELKVNFAKFYFFAVGIMQEGILKTLAAGVDGGKFIFVQNSQDLIKEVISIKFE